MIKKVTNNINRFKFINASKYINSLIQPATYIPILNT